MKVKMRQRCNFIVKSESNSVANKTLKSEHLKIGDGQQILITATLNNVFAVRRLRGAKFSKNDFTMMS